MVASPIVRLPYTSWPAADRAAWTAALAKGDILEGTRGAASHWAPLTRKTNKGHYASWLGFLKQSGRLNPTCRPAQRVSRKNVTDYVCHLRLQVAPRTVVTMLVGLKVTIKAMAPKTDWKWLAEICNALNRVAEPKTDKRSRMRPIQEIYSAAIGQMDKLLQSGIVNSIQRIAFRDNLMLALMALRPLRLWNFSTLEIGRHLVRDSGDWWIRIPGAETKNRLALDFTFPRPLLPYLDIYLNRVRPIFVRKRPLTALWVGQRGDPLTPHAAYYRFRFLTPRLFGVLINPHLLRDCAATSLSMHSPAAALASGPLLGHRSFQTTEKYYIRANRLDASRKLNSALLSLQKSLTG